MRLLPGLSNLASCWNECSELRRLKKSGGCSVAPLGDGSTGLWILKSGLRLCDVQEGGAAEGGRYLICAKRCRSAGSRDGGVGTPAGRWELESSRTWSNDTGD